MKRKLILFLMVGVCATLLANSALAASVAIDWTASGQADGNILQWTFGSQSAANPANWGTYVDGKLWAVGENKTAAGDFFLSSSAFTTGQDSFVRAWNTKSLPTASTDDSSIKYGYLKTQAGSTNFEATSGITENLYSNSGALSLNLSAAKPAPPTVSVGDFALAYNDAAQDYLPSFTVSGKAGTAYATEIVAWQVAVRKQGDANWHDTVNASSANIKETSPNTPYYVAGDWYEAMSGCRSNFGGGAMVYSDPTQFQIPVTKGLLGGSSFTFDLLPVETDKLVINTIFLPAMTLTSPENIAVAKASDLAGVVDRASGEKVVVAVCKWDPVAGESISAVFDPAGNLITGSTDFDLKLGEAYQIYTTRMISVTLR